MSLSVERHGAVTLLRLDRPPVNALDLPTIGAIVDAVAGVREGAIVIAGRPGQFSAGIDLKAMLRYGPAEHRQVLGAVNALCHGLVAAPVPTVAAVTGNALGGGLIISCCCDWRVGADGVFALPEVRAGIPFPAGAMAVVRHAMPPLAARRLGLADQRIDAAEALSLGLLDERVAPERVVEVALAHAERLATLPGRVLTQTRRALYAELLRALELARGEHEATAPGDWVGDDTRQAAGGVLERLKG